MQINIDQYRQKYQQQATELAGRFRDVRFTGQVVFVGIVLLISWSGVKTIQTNYQLQKQISTLKQQNAVAKLQNDNLALQNQYYNTNEYLELSARSNLGMAKAGEKELLVPQSVAYAYAPAVNVPSATETATATHHVSNLQSWIDFFMHRPMQ